VKQMLIANYNLQRLPCAVVNQMMITEKRFGYTLFSKVFGCCVDKY
jgi:hypothetical protein